MDEEQITEFMEKAFRCLEELHAEMHYQSILLTYAMARAAATAPDPGAELEKLRRGSIDQVNRMRQAAISEGEQTRRLDLVLGMMSDRWDSEISELMRIVQEARDNGIPDTGP